MLEPTTPFIMDLTCNPFGFFERCKNDSVDRPKFYE